MNLNELKPVESVNLHKLVEEQLTSLFTSSDLRPGNKIPSERVLQEHLGVSRAVLREALRILESKGLIEGKQGKGRFIRADLGIYSRESSFHQLEKLTLGEFYEARMALEPAIAGWAAERATEKDIKVLVTALKETDIDLPDRADFVFHLALANASHNRMAYRTLQEYFEIQSLYSEKLFENVRSEYPLEEWQQDHLKILAAIRARDSKLAREIMYNHLKNSFEFIK